MKVRTMFITVENAHKGQTLSGVFGEIDSVTYQDGKLIIVGDDMQVHGIYNVEDVKILQDLGEMTREEAKQKAFQLMVQGDASALYGAYDVHSEAEEQEEARSYKNGHWTKDEAPDTDESDDREPTLDEQLIETGKELLSELLKGIDESQKKRRGNQ